MTTRMLAVRGWLRSRCSSVQPSTRGIMTSIKMTLGVLLSTMEIACWGSFVLTKQ